MGDKIEYNDLFSPDAFSKAVEGINSIKVAFEGLSNEFKTILVEQKQFQEGFKVRSYDDIVKLNKSLAETEKTLKDFTAAQNAVKQSDIELAKLAQEKQKLQQQQIKTEIEYQKLQKITNAESKKKITLYQQESKTLNELRNKYKDLALSEKGASKEAQDLLAQITKLDAKLKAVDASVGQFQRNVGNYTGALDTFRTGVTNILGAAGIGVGLSEGINFLKESFAEFQKSEKATKELGFALKNVGGEGVQALSKLSDQAQQLEENLGLFEAEDIQGLQKELVNLGASSSQVEALTPKILDLAKATGMDLASATDVAVKAINGQTKGLKSVGLEFENTGSRTENYNILLEKLDKFQGAAANSADTLEGKQQRIAIAWGNVKEAVGEYLAGAGSELLDAFDVLTGKVTLFDNALRKLTPLFNEQAKEIVKYNLQAKAKTSLEQRYLEVLNDQNLTLEEKNEKSEIILKQVKAINAAIAEQNNLGKRNQKLFVDDKIGGGGKTKKDEEDGYAKYKAEQERLRQIDEENNVIIIEEKEKVVKTAAELEAERVADALQFSALQYEKQKKLDEEEAERKKKLREEELKELFDVASKIISIAEKEIKAKEKLREDALNKEIEDRENNIERQRELADKGLQNTLAFEQQKLAEADRRKQDEAEKSIKREKTLAFFKLFAANAEKDPNTALQKTIIESLLADAVAGSFFKGTEKVSEDLKGNKVHSGKDGYVVAVDGSERVLTGKQNELIGNMSNEDLARLANDYQNGLLPKYAITDSMSSMNTAEKLVSSAQLHQLVSLNKNIEDLKQTIINKKEVSLAIDNLGNVLRTEIENGVKRVEITKSNKSRI